MFYTELRLWHKDEVDFFLVSFSEFHYWVFLHTCLPASSSLPTVLSVYLLLCTRSGLEMSGVRQNYFVKVIAWMYESSRTWDILQSWDQEKNKGPILCPRPGELLKPSFFRVEMFYLCERTPTMSRVPFPAPCPTYRALCPCFPPHPPRTLPFQSLRVWHAFLFYWAHRTIHEIRKSSSFINYIFFTCDLRYTNMYRLDINRQTYLEYSMYLPGLFRQMPWPFKGSLWLVKDF